jgi:cytoskeletal protein RodZ
MNQPTTERYRRDESTASEKKAAKTAVKKMPKPSGKAVVKASSKVSAKSAAKATATKVVATPVVANAAASTPVPAAEAVEVSATKASKTAKPKKDKLIRDSFTMPESEYNLIAEVKRRCLANGVAVKKSEVLRAAIVSFAALPDATLGAVLQAQAVIKTGCPPKEAK